MGTGRSAPLGQGPRLVLTVPVGDSFPAGREQLWLEGWPRPRLGRLKHVLQNMQVREQPQRWHRGCPQGPSGHVRMRAHTWVRGFLALLIM